MCELRLDILRVRLRELHGLDYYKANALSHPVISFHLDVDFHDSTSLAGANVA